MVSHERHVHQSLRQTAGAYFLVVNHLDYIGDCAEELGEALFHVVEFQILVGNGLVVQINAKNGDILNDILRGT